MEIFRKEYRSNFRIAQALGMATLKWQKQLNQIRTKMEHS